MKVNCDNCGKEINKSPSDVKKENFCNKKCRHDFKHIIRNCCMCGKEFERLKVASSPTPLCGSSCAKTWQSKHMTKLNIELNPDRMDLETRLKVREGRLVNGEQNTKGYKKFLGRHIHRIVAENKLGRPLKKGEVVHHLDKDIHNNSDDNLEVLENQAEHARLHMNERWYVRKK